MIIPTVEQILKCLGKEDLNRILMIEGSKVQPSDMNGAVDLLILGISSKEALLQIKMSLTDYYSEKHRVFIAQTVENSTTLKSVTTCVSDLDSLEWTGGIWSVLLPKVDENTEKYYNMNNLVKIMARLRSKEGCPWDIKQTHDTLKPYLLEETYEVLEALEKEDRVLLKEELGDLLLQVVFHSQIASEAGVFAMEDVIAGICEKLIYRHPHVFGQNKEATAMGALQRWEEMKQKEKAIETHTEALMRIPKQLPALMRSYKVQEKAAKVGFDWDNIHDVIEKIKEELQELMEAYSSGNREDMKEETGDLLFAVVNVARFLGVEPELALTGTTDKFIERMAFMEEAAKKQGTELKDLSLKELDDLWNLAKIHKNKKKDKKYK